MDDLKTMYESGLSLTQIGDATGVAFQTVHKRLRKLGVTMRPAGSPANHVIVTHEARAFLDGLLLGDGAYAWTKRYKSAAVTIGQADVRAAWVYWIQQQLLKFDIVSCLEEIEPHLVGGYCSKSQTHCRSRYYAELLAERQRWYPEGKKIVPADIVLDPITIALWYFGDGHLATRPDGYSQITIATNCFTEADCAILCDQLQSRYGVTSRINKGPVVRINKQRDIEVFLNLVAPFSFPCLDYKIKQLRTEVQLVEQKDRL